MLIRYEFVVYYVCTKAESLNIYKKGIDNKIFLCIDIHQHKSKCKIRCSKTQKRPSFAIFDLVTLTPRFQMKFFTLQFTVIMHYTFSSKKSYLHRVPLFVFLKKN